MLVSLGSRPVPRRASTARGWTAEGSASATNLGDRQPNAIPRTDADLHVFQLSVRADHKMAAVGDQHAHEALLAPDAVLYRHCVVLVGEERKRQGVLGFERLVALPSLTADAEHHRVLILDYREFVPEAASLSGAAGR